MTAQKFWNLKNMPMITYQALIIMWLKAIPYNKNNKASLAKGVPILRAKSRIKEEDAVFHKCKLVAE